MYRTLALSIFLCCLTFQVGITDSLPKLVEIKEDVTTPAVNPQPTHSTTVGPVTTPSVKPTTSPTTTSPSTSTSKPTTPSSPPTSTSVSPPTSTTTKPSSTTPSTTTPRPAPSTNGTTTTAVPPTTSIPPTPTPSDRKFDAFSFLGGFALGLGLVAIGFLSWKFYLSRQENYYHTL